MDFGNNPNEAIFDELTGAYRKSLLWPRLGEELERCVRFEIPLALVIIDIDQFKTINDVYGHLRGDAILHEFGRIIRHCLRRTDIFFRYGGDEFVLVFPHTPREESISVVERLFKRVRETIFAGDPPLQLLLSAGLSYYPEDGHVEQRLFEVADRRLKEAKRKGGDTWVTSSSDTAQSGLRLQPVRLLEREEFKNVLDAFVESFRQGSSAILEICGEWGSGKTRALKEAVNMLQMLGNHVLSINTDPSISRFSFGLIRELVQNIFKEHPEVLQKLAKETADDLRAFWGTSDINSKRRPITDSGAYRLHQEVMELLMQVVPKGVVFAIDDLHFADEHSLELFRTLIMLSRGYPMAMVYTRPDTVELEGSWQSPHIHFSQCRLRPLSYRGVKNLVMRWLKWDPPEELVQYLYTLTGGNLVLLERLLMGLYDDGMIYRIGDEWVYKGGVESGEWPSTVFEFVKQRLLRLSDEAQVIAEILSVLEGQANIDMLKEAAGFDEEKMGQALRELVREGIIWEMIGGNYRFRYEILSRIIYSSLEDESRVGMHHRVAQAMERSSKVRGEHTLEVLAFHFQMAGDHVRSTHYYMESARGAIHNHAYTDAIEMLQKALKQAEEHDLQVETVEILYLLSYLYGLIGRYDLQNNTAQHALSIMKDETPSNRRWINLVFNQAEALLNLGQYQEADKLLRRAIFVQVDPYSETGLSLRLLKARIAEVHTFQSETESLYREVLEDALRLPSPKIAHNAAAFMALYLLKNLHFIEAGKVLHDIVGRHWSRDPRESVLLLYALGKSIRHTDNVTVAHNYLVEAFQIAYIHGMHDQATQTALVLSEIARLQGYWETSSRWAAAAREQAYRGRDQDLKMKTEWMLWICSLISGDAELLVTQVERLSHYLELDTLKKPVDTSRWLYIGASHFTWSLTSGALGCPYPDQVQYMASSFLENKPETLDSIQSFIYLLNLLAFMKPEEDYPDLHPVCETLLKELEDRGEKYMFPRIVYAWTRYACARGKLNDDMLAYVVKACKISGKSGLLRLSHELYLMEIIIRYHLTKRKPAEPDIQKALKSLSDLSIPSRENFYKFLEHIQYPGDWSTVRKELEEKTRIVIPDIC